MRDAFLDGKGNGDCPPKSLLVHLVLAFSFRNSRTFLYMYLCVCVCVCVGWSARDRLIGTKRKEWLRGSFLTATTDDAKRARWLPQRSIGIDRGSFHLAFTR